MEFAATFTLISNAITTTKQIYDAGHELDKAHLKLKSAEQIDALTQAKLTLSEAQETIARKDKEIATLRENFRRSKEDLIESRGYLYRKASDGTPEGLPYCQRCLEVDGMLVRCAELRGTEARCPQCKSEYQATVWLWEDDR
jgi:uncharacterized coiled-coil protein SlyX